MVINIGLIIVPSMQITMDWVLTMVLPQYIAQHTMIAAAFGVIAPINPAAP